MSGPAYDLDPVVAARLGLIVLQADETVERDFRRLFHPDVPLHVSRIPSGADLTAETIARMELDLPRAAALFPSGAQFDTVGYACTSGTTLIGPDRVAELVREGCAATHVTNPLSAAFEALAHVGASRIALVSPYNAQIAGALARTFERVGVAVPAAISFGEEVEANVARITPGSIAEAARSLAGAGNVDAVFLSCTNLRTLDIIAPLERELGRPVISSNLALAWAMAARSGTAIALDGFRLLRGGAG
ncbi:Asp/Glu/Hydantoin racemase family protein [Pseudooceanicola batsensis HTCC2597]|uniref:Asp/Glu/Hydantoin racemase family protein n=1 Tax=Pseudooceanicola batsensis (strain ATCC BAA-863 / DSM 15984 / KCTC 12145 / HTCC2597) TaxID=252305 RepID=A3TVD4_PSEBH|nr:aspartate/glutamate racemase family protein [Pseudooceanicola batsensis]EAQ04480.1 Asp/Glu/Hydantoin racemase family protein [Pseudooceanicola batsensis HTCC2597]